MTLIALFPFLWLVWQFDLHSYLTDEFLDMIIKTKNTNVGNDNLDNVSNKAPGDTNEDDLEGLDVDKDKLLGKEYLDPWRTPTGSCEKWTVFNT